MTDTQMTFGQTMRALRRKAEISQEELGKLLGVDRTYINKIERGVWPAGKRLRRRALRVLTGGTPFGVHKDDCRMKRAAESSVAIECEHGWDCCPVCDPCTCDDEVEV